VSRLLHWTVLGLALAVGVAIGIVISVAHSSTTVADTQTPGLTNPQLDPGARLNAPAPDFALTDQFGKRLKLSSLRGKVVVLSFNDPQCTTICPLTTTALLHAKTLLGPAASRVALIGVGANPQATEVKWVRAYSRAHGMLHKWRFLTGSLPELKRVWRAYFIQAAVENGSIDHTPATFLIGPNGREARLYETPMAYSSVNQFGYELARSIAALLAGHPRLHGKVSLARPMLYGPHDRVTLPRAGGGSVRLGPGSGPHLVLFFDTWETEITDLSKQLEALNRYQAAARRQGLPPLVAIDEVGVEASARALPRFLHALPHPLAYPVAVDRSGTVADGYRVLDSPWLELVSDKGRILFAESLAERGWPTLRQLLARTRVAQAK
jgi:cytochrome oxidase Cu insertion factor (SCO1/SenC/PrrC family)